MITTTMEAITSPRWARKPYSKATKRDTQRDPEFYQKASHVLRDQGYSQPASAKVLGISERSVRSHLAKPSAALKVEREEVAKRKRIVGLQRRAPFDVMAYLREARPPFAVDLLGFDPWSSEDIGTSTREKVAFYLTDGWSQTEIAGLLGISRQAVAKHVEKIRHDVSKALRRKGQRK